MTSHSNGSLVAVLDRVIGVPTATNDNNDTATSEPLFQPTVDDTRESKRIRLDDTAKPRSVRFDPSQDSTHAIPPRPTAEQLLAHAEAHADVPRHLLDPYSSKSLQIAAAALEKTYSQNMLLRARHGDDAEKFMDNELRLHDEIVSFKNVAVYVEAYELLVRCGVVGTFLALLSHENSDVAMSVINVLVELLDPALLEEEEVTKDDHEDAEARRTRRVYNLGLLGDEFVAGGGLEALVSNLGRFDERVEEDAKGVEDTLTLLEYLLDLDRAGALRREEGRDESVVASVCKTRLLSWLFRRIEKNSSDDDDVTASAPISPAVLRLHASEVLATVLQHEDYSINRCGPKLASCPEYTSIFHEGEEKPPADASGDGAKVDGMEILLLAIADYRKSDPQVEVECEFLENVFDALAASLLRPDNVADFVEKEGIELMLRCIREKVHAGGGALKVLNFALSGSAPEETLEKSSENNPPSNPIPVYKRACEVFVHAGGLKLLFPLYMARKSAIPSPAACSEGGSDLAKKAIASNGKSTSGELSKRAKRAAHARKKWLAEVEEHVIYVMYALTRHIDKESKYDSYSRLLVKFVEEECEKCDRTIELCLKYDEKARVAEYQYFRSDEAEEAEQLGLDVDVAAIGAKLRGGGDIYHRLCAILSFACVGSARSHGHVRDQLKLQGSSISAIKEGLTEFASLLVAGSQKAQIECYLSNI